MPTLYTPLLGFSLPTQGELSGTWGDVTNTSLTNLADTAIAGTTTLSSDADVTLTATVGAANQARSAVLLCTGTRTALRNITAPASSKKYTVINNTVGGFAVVIRGSGPTAGITVPWGAVVEVVWYGTDFIAVGAPATGITGAVAIANGGTGQTTAAAALAALGGAPLASPTFTGTVTIPSGASIAGYVQANSPAFTGTPTAPTAAVATSNTQLATTQFVKDVFGTVPAGALPTPIGQAGKFLQVNSGESGVQWSFAGISQVTTATTATMLTNTPTLLQITPASYGVTVTLPDATTCSLGGPLHCIDNRGAYPVRVCDSTGALKGFIFAGVVSYISLDNNSTAAGQWAISSNELVGASAQLLNNLISSSPLNTVLDLGSGREFIMSSGTTGSAVYAVVYDKTSNTFGAVTLVRSGLITGGALGVLSAANQVLVVSCTATTAFEAVTLTISGTTITVNTAATATLSANISAFADGCGLIAVGSSFVTSYTVATPAAQIRALSISGTTVTIGSASVLDGTAGGLIAAAANHVIAVSTATTHLYTKPYLVSGSTLTAGTGTDSGASTATVNKFTALGTRWAVLYFELSMKGGIVSLNTTGNGTTTISVATVDNSGNTIQDAIVIGSNKVLVLNGNTTNNANIILTDTAGTASAGTAITLSGETTRACVYASGTDVLIQDGPASSGNNRVIRVDCSGSSPVSAFQKFVGSNAPWVVYQASNSVLDRSASAVYGTQFAQRLLQSINNSNSQAELRIQGTGQASIRYVPDVNRTMGTFYRGKASSERWGADGSTMIIKVEAAV